MKVNLKLILFVIFTLIYANGFGQENEQWNHELGINLLQIPATTIDLTYEITNHPRYSMVLNSGFTINYSKTFDVVGFFLSPHAKCGNYGYTMKKQTGGFLKIGMKYNFRNTIEKRNYFFLGVFLTNSLIDEKAEYKNMDIQDSPVENLNHNIYIIGATGSVGYNFKISNRLNSDFGLQISVPSGKFKDLYGYNNYIPGMGYMDTCDAERSIFPMLVLNLKYRL